MEDRGLAGTTANPTSVLHGAGVGEIQRLCQPQGCDQPARSLLQRPFPPLAWEPLGFGRGWCPFLRPGRRPRRPTQPGPECRAAEAPCGELLQAGAAEAPWEELGVA